MMSDEMKNKGRCEKTGVLNGQSKFWAYEIRGTTVTIQFGKLGTQGVRASRDFDTIKDAEEFVETRLKKKLNEGYRPVT
jgi:predicted DNA-binding WGR domain protein